MTYIPELLRTDKIMKPKETGNKIVTRGSGANNVANVKWAKGTKEGKKVSKQYIMRQADRAKLIFSNFIRMHYSLSLH